MTNIFQVKKGCRNAPFFFICPVETKKHVLRNRSEGRDKVPN